MLRSVMSVSRFGYTARGTNMDLEVMRAILRRNRLWEAIRPDVSMLRVIDDVGKALTDEEEQRLLAACEVSMSPGLYTAVALALYSGMRVSEVRLLKWNQVDFERQFLQVGQSKTQHGQGRIVPLYGFSLAKTACESRLSFTTT